MQTEGGAADGPKANGPKPKLFFALSSCPPLHAALGSPAHACQQRPVRHPERPDLVKSRSYAAKLDRRSLLSKNKKARSSRALHFLWLTPSLLLMSPCGSRALPPRPHVIQSQSFPAEAQRRRGFRTNSENFSVLRASPSPSEKTPATSAPPRDSIPAFFQSQSFPAEAQGRRGLRTKTENLSDLSASARVLPLPINLRDLRASHSPRPPGRCGFQSPPMGSFFND